MDTEVRMAALTGTIRILMEGTPEDGPIAVAFHSNRRSQNFFGGGKDVFHEIFCGLLSNGVRVCELFVEAMCNGSHDGRKPVVRLAGGDGDQDEKQCEGSHDLSPCLECLNGSSWEA